jgi:hypothetical protein
MHAVADRGEGLARTSATTYERATTTFLLGRAMAGVQYISKRWRRDGTGVRQHGRH